MIADRLAVLGADIGQARDPSALAVLRGYDVLHLERLPLGTSYSLVAERIDVVARAAGASIALDATGVGRAVVDLLRARGQHPLAVTLHGGQLVRRNANGASIPRRMFLRPLVAAVEQGRLRVAQGIPGAAAFADELLAARQRGLATEARGAGHHGDLLIAISLALWAQAPALAAR
jgi:hypothetical protein